MRPVDRKRSGGRENAEKSEECGRGNVGRGFSLRAKAYTASVSIGSSDFLSGEVVEHRQDNRGSCRANHVYAEINRGTASNGGGETIGNGLTLCSGKSGFNLNATVMGQRP